MTIHMPMDDLAAQDAAERRRYHQANITTLEQVIARKKAEGGRTDCLQRHLDTLTAQPC